MLVERGAQRADAPVHHVARRDDVGAGRGLGDRGAREQLERLRRCRPTPSSRSTPQWPCDVYSHRQRSVMTSRSGCAALIARVASWTTPSSSHAPEPSSSLLGGQAEQQHAGDPERRGDRRPPRPRRRSRGDRCPASRRSACASGRSRRRTSDRRGARPRARSRARGRAARRSAQAAQAGGGEGHPPQRLSRARSRG